MRIKGVDIRVCRPDNPKICRTVHDAVIDTRAVVSAIPATILSDLGIPLAFKRTFTLNCRRAVRDWGVALIGLKGRREVTASDVIARKRGPPVVSWIVLQNIGFKVDRQTRQLRRLPYPHLLRL